MKKTLLLFFSSMLFLSQFAFSQVKKQFKDETFAQTTVIIKEDNASDADILNDLDLDHIGMSQQIRITTEVEKPKPVVIPVVEKKEKRSTKELKTGLEKEVTITPDATPKAVVIDNSSKTAKVAGALPVTRRATPQVQKKSTKSAIRRNKVTRKKNKRKRSRKRFKKKRRKSYKKKYACFRF